MTLYVFDTSKRDAAIAQFALDKCSGRTFVPIGEGANKVFRNFTANDIAALLREFFDAPTSQKLIAQRVGSATGISGDTPVSPLPPMEQP